MPKTFLGKCAIKEDNGGNRNGNGLVWDAGLKKKCDKKGDGMKKILIN